MSAAGGQVFAMTTTQVVAGIACGLGLFLAGLAQVTASMRILAGPRLKLWATRLTRSPARGAVTGASISGLLQSSSATSVLVIGLVSAGVLSLEQSLGVLLGANIGTTLTAQLIAFDALRVAAAVGLAGLIFALLGPRGPARHAGAAAFGLGVLFAGMALMSASASSLQARPELREALAFAEHPVAGVLIGAVVTVLLQSSSATIGLVIVLAGQGLLSLESGLALLLGANVGTCATGFLAALGKPRDALRAALAHLMINAVGVLLFLPMLQPLAAMARAISPSAPSYLTASERIADDLPRQVANAHLIFNLATVLLLIGFTPLLARIVRAVVPERRPRVVQ